MTTTVRTMCQAANRRLVGWGAIPVREDLPGGSALQSRRDAMFVASPSQEPKPQRGEIARCSGLGGEPWHSVEHLVPLGLGYAGLGLDYKPCVPPGLANCGQVHRLARADDRSRNGENRGRAKSARAVHPQVVGGRKSFAASGHAAYTRTTERCRPGALTGRHRAPTT
jgi:hypothetical protein